MKPDYKLVAKAKYIHTTADLASELWHEVYKRYYPAKQLDTLVDTLQSADAIEEDIDNDVNYFLVLLGGKVWIDPGKNTAETWVQGWLTVDYDAEGPAPMQRLTFQFNRNTGYYDELAANAASAIARLSA